MDFGRVKCWNRAICRADEQWCRLDNAAGNLIFFGQNGGWTKNRANSVKIPLRNFEHAAINYQARKDLPGLGHYKAMVPTIPVHLRPKGDLKNYHILWEAEWEAAVPVDPILLRPGWIILAAP